MKNPFPVIGRFAGRYILNVLLGLDQLGNTLLAGAPDETISARTGRNIRKRGWRVLGWGLNKIDPGHTTDAVQSERKGSEQAKAYGDVYDPEDSEPKHASPVHNSRIANVQDTVH